MRVIHRPREALPHLTAGALNGPLLLDTNVFLNALAGRGPPELAALLDNLPQVFVSGPVIAELSWAIGRLDPAHPGTSRMIELYTAILARISDAKVLVPDAAEWRAAGELAGRAARALAGGGAALNAGDRVELLGDAVTAVVAMRAGVTIITADGDFDIFAQLEPSLAVRFYG